MDKQELLAQSANFWHASARLHACGEALGVVAAGSCLALAGLMIEVGAFELGAAFWGGAALSSALAVREEHSRSIATHYAHLRDMQRRAS